MKSFALKAACVGLMCVSSASFADKVIISGDPVVLEKKGDVYMVPATAAEVTTTYHYVTVDGKNQVCYMEPQTTFASLEPTTLKVNVNGTDASWSCYEYNTEYFEVKP